MIQKNVQRILVGSALVFAARAIIPVAGQTLKPLVGGLSRQMRYLLVSTKEGLEDIVAEVKFERMKQQLNYELAIDMDEIEQSATSYH
jgi:hypothetical protein